MIQDSKDKEEQQKINSKLENSDLRNINEKSIRTMYSDSTVEEDRDLFID